MLKRGRYWPWKTVSSRFHMPVRPMLLHRMALVSFRLFCKKIGQLASIFWVNGLPPPQPPPLTKNCPYAYDQKHFPSRVVKITHKYPSGPHHASQNPFTTLMKLLPERLSVYVSKVSFGVLHWINKNIKSWKKNYGKRGMCRMCSISNSGAKWTGCVQWLSQWLSVSRCSKVLL